MAKHIEIISEFIVWIKKASAQTKGLQTFINTHLYRLHIIIQELYTCETAKNIPY